MQKDIPTMQLEDEEIAGDLRAQLRRELGGILERWESDRSEDAYQKKRPLLNSSEWVAIEASYGGNCKVGTAKWQNWRTETIEGEWILLGILNLAPRRRPVLDITAEIGGYRRKRSYRGVAPGRGGWGISIYQTEPKSRC